MNNQEIQTRIDNFRDNLGRVRTSMIKKQDPELLDLRDNYINTNFTILKDQILNSTEALKWTIFYNQYQEEDVLCPVCKQKLVKFWNAKKGSFCSDNCRKAGGEFIKEKLIQSNKEKYGTVSTSQVKENRDKQIKTKLIKKYGEEKANILLDRNEIIKRFKANDLNEIDIEKFENFFNMERQIARKWLNKHNLTWARGRNKLELSLLYEINPTQMTYYKQFSKNKKEFKEHYKNLNIIFNDKKTIKPFEIDLYFKDFNFAIEFDGIYWHSYGITNNTTNRQADQSFQKYRHLKKTEACEEKGIHLFHIFEDEWHNKNLREIWISKINYKLNLIKNKADARKLKIIELDSKKDKEKLKKFLNENHLQGYRPSKINLALVNENNEIYSVMTFDKSRYDKNYEYELIRFASKKFFVCRGCAQKLFKYFLSKFEPKSIISYANRRWTFSKNNIYLNLGFKYIRKTQPNYFYVKPGKNLKRTNRIAFQKHKLKKLKEFEEVYDDKKTELEIVLSKGYRALWDAGNLVYEFKL